MSVSPKRFVVYKQGALDYLCGFYCLAMLRKNFGGEGPDYHPERDFHLWLSKHHLPVTKGIGAEELDTFCQKRVELRGLGLRHVEGDLTGYEYGIAMVALSEEGKLWTHYVVFFNHDGEVYIADPHPYSPSTATKCRGKFTRSWMVKKGDPRWANKKQKSCWPRPGWALGSPLEM